MVENKYVSFIEKLIEQTKKERIAWQYLDSNKDLCKNMRWMESNNGLAGMVEFLGQAKETFEFDVERSFYCTKNQNYIVLYVSNGNPPILLVIPFTYKKIIQLLPDDYGDWITRLLNLVESQFPSAEAFIDGFLKEKD